METRNLICIGCPKGCPLTVSIDGGAVSVSGNSCVRGETYGKKEVTNPTRTVTSSIRVRGGEIPVVSCKTAEDIPKDKIFDVMHEIRAVRVDAPVTIGQVLIPNCAGTGIPVIATKTVAAAGLLRMLGAPESPN